jgi:hypothetical protein
VGGSLILLYKERAFLVLWLLIFLYGSGFSIIS